MRRHMRRSLAVGAAGLFLMTLFVRALFVRARGRGEVASVVAQTPSPPIDLPERPGRHRPQPARYKYTDYANALRTSPNRWAKYPGEITSPRGMVTLLQQDEAGRSFPSDEFEFRYMDGEVHLRYVGKLGE